MCSSLSCCSLTTFRKNFSRVWFNRIPHTFPWIQLTRNFCLDRNVALLEPRSGPFAEIVHHNEHISVSGIADRKRACYVHRYPLERCAWVILFQVRSCSSYWTFSCNALGTVCYVGWYSPILGHFFVLRPSLLCLWSALAGHQRWIPYSLFSRSAYTLNYKVGVKEHQHFYVNALRCSMLKL